MEVTGKIKVINPSLQVSASFKKRELVVTTDEQYPQHIMIEFTQDKCDLLNNYSIGEPVKVSINLRGREWVNPQGEAKYFNSIQGWRIEKVIVQGPEPQRANSAVNQYENTSAAEGSIDSDPDDLPF